MTMGYVTLMKWKAAQTQVPVITMPLQPTMMAPAHMQKSIMIVTTAVSPTQMEMEFAMSLKRLAVKTQMPAIGACQKKKSAHMQQSIMIVTTSVSMTQTEMECAMSWKDKG